MTQSPSTSPGEADRLERERQRLREQERRRREAVSVCHWFCTASLLEKGLFLIKGHFGFTQMAGQIDMNLQSELLAAFEEDVL